MYKLYKPFNFLKLLHLLVLLAWLTFMTVLLALPMPSLGESTGFTWKDKLVHLLIFGWLARLLAGWLHRYTKSSALAAAWLAAALALATAAAFEFVQAYVPSRSVSDLDWLAGALGVLLSLGVWLYWQYRWPKRVDKPRLLLHACCGPCGSALSGELAERFQVTLFFCNPNIDTEAEFKLRWHQAKVIARFWNLPAVEVSYDHRTWRRKVRGLEAEPEKGARCAVCYGLRLQETAKYAKAQKFDYFGTTLSVSPQKDYAQVLAIGQALAAKFKLKFVADDFKKRDGYKKSVRMAKDLELYRQDYCGCEFSRRS